MGHGGSESAAPPSAALLGALGALGLLRRPSSPRLRRGKLPDLIHARIAAEGSHVILFRSGVESLEIVRVLHAAMDFKRHYEVTDK